MKFPQNSQEIDKIVKTILPLFLFQTHLVVVAHVHVDSNTLDKEQVQKQILHAINRRGYEGLKTLTIDYETACYNRANEYLDGLLGPNNHQEITNKVRDFFEEHVKHHYEDSESAVKAGDSHAYAQIASEQGASTWALCDQMHQIARNEAARAKV